MRPVTRLLLAGAGSVALCASGCFGPMYNPNGPWGAPGYSQYNNYPAYGNPSGGYPGSFQTLTPGPQYAPSGVIDPGAGASPTPTYQGDPGNYGGGNVPVPTPVDPNVPNPYFGSPTGMYTPNPSDNFVAPRSGMNVDPNSDAPPFSAIHRPNGAAPLTAAADGGNAPLLVRPTGLARSNSSGDKSPYGYDSSSYDWLEGVVSFDRADQTWNIVYDVDPASEDEFAGHFTLSPSPLLKTFREGERVRLEGRVDPVERDRFGKATYLPERIIRSAV
ncbi:MAG: hypothetical protein KDA75_01460 [Planctomycetaceae bacterium]|nr:hypothetical protein [Planctomycetaceae bacterium]